MEDIAAIGVFIVIVGGAFAAIVLLDKYAQTRVGTYVRYLGGPALFGLISLEPLLSGSVTPLYRGGPPFEGPPVRIIAGVLFIVCLYLGHSGWKDARNRLAKQRDLTDVEPARSDRRLVHPVYVKSVVRGRSQSAMSDEDRSAQMESETQFIHRRCLDVVRGASMNVPHWEMTILDGLHPAISDSLRLEDGELPVISFFAGVGDWTVYTTHRMLGEVDGTRTQIDCSDFGACDFGNFKQDLDSPRVTVAVISDGKKKSRFLYESGYASIAPIYYFRFWSIKWPIWKKTYEIEKGRQNQRVESNAGYAHRNPRGPLST